MQWLALEPFYPYTVEYRVGDRVDVLVLTQWVLDTVPIIVDGVVMKIVPSIDGYHDPEYWVLLDLPTLSSNRWVFKRIQPRYMRLKEVL